MKCPDSPCIKIQMTKYAVIAEGIPRTSIPPLDAGYNGFLHTIPRLIAQRGGSVWDE